MWCVVTGSKGVGGGGAAPAVVATVAEVVVGALALLPSL